MWVRPTSSRGTRWVNLGGGEWDTQIEDNPMPSAYDGSDGTYAERAFSSDQGTSNALVNCNFFTPSTTSLDIDVVRVYCRVTSGINSPTQIHVRQRVRDEELYTDTGADIVTPIDVPFSASPTWIRIVLPTRYSTRDIRVTVESTIVSVPNATTRVYDVMLERSASVSAAMVI